MGKLKIYLVNTDVEIPANNVQQFLDGLNALLKAAGAFDRRGKPVVFEMVNRLARVGEEE